MARKARRPPGGRYSPQARSASPRARRARGGRFLRGATIPRRARAPSRRARGSGVFRPGAPREPGGGHRPARGSKRRDQPEAAAWHVLHFPTERLDLGAQTVRLLEITGGTSSEPRVRQLEDLLGSLGMLG